MNSREEKKARQAQISKLKKQQPFEHQPDDRDSNLVEARSHVEDAIEHISSAMLSAENWADYETMMYFRNQLEEMMSSDGGETGFSIYR